MQALWCERVAAFNTAANYATQAGSTVPGSESFGIDEAALMLRRLGAAPSSY